MVFLAGNDRFFPAADLQLVAIGIFKEAGVIAGALAAAKLGAFRIFSADFAHQPREPIDFCAALGPKSDSGAVRLMASVPCKTEERFRFIAAGGIEYSPPSARAVANKPERRQQLAIKLLRALQIGYAQVNVIEVSLLFHFY